MSVTTRTLTSTIYNIVANGSVSGATTKLSIVYSVDNVIYGLKKKSDLLIYVDGVKQSPTWTSNKTANYFGETRYTKVTSSTLSISKPFFTLTLYMETTDYALYSKTFSFYDIENAATIITPSGGSMDGSTNTTVTYNGTSSDCTFNTTFSLGSNSKSVTSSTKTTNYAIPLSWCNALPDATSGKLNISGQVLFGGKVYKTLTGSLTVNVPASVVPTISSITLSDVSGTPVPSGWGIYVQNQSGVKLSAMTCAGAYSSTIKTVKMAVGSQSASSTYSTLPQISKVTQSGSLSVVVTVTDSRNRIAVKSTTVNVVEYTAPKFTTVKSERCKSDGTLDNDGQYFLSTTAVSYATCSGKNSITLKVKYKKTSLASYGSDTTIQPGTNICGANSLNTEFSYDILYTLSDQFNTITYLDYVSTAVYLMHFLHGGTGIAFGQKSTMPNTVDFAFDALFRGNIDYMRSDGTKVSLKEIAQGDFLPIGGGTLTGPLTIAPGNNHEGFLYCGDNLRIGGSATTSGNRGIYETALKQWMVYMNANNLLCIPGAMLVGELTAYNDTTHNGWHLGTDGTAHGHGSSAALNLWRNAYYNRVLGASGLTANVTSTLPSTTGTLANLSDCQYKAGDTLTLGATLCAGEITGSSANIRFNIPVSKYIAASNVTATALSLIVRSVNGYAYYKDQVGGSTSKSVLNISGLTVTTTVSSHNTIRVTMNCTSGSWTTTSNGSTAITNNTPVAVSVGSATFTFS